MLRMQVKSQGLLFAYLFLWKLLYEEYAIRRIEFCSGYIHTVS